MSASRERNKRRAQEQVPAAPVVKKKKKLSEGWILAICVVLVLAVVFGAIAMYSSYQRNHTVLTIGERELSATEFNYFFYNQAFQLNSYASLLGISPNTDLAEQKVSVSAGSFMGMLGMSYDFTNVANDGTNYDITWAEVFADGAKTAAVQVYSVYDKAMAAGYTLSEEDAAVIDDELAMLQAYGSASGLSADDYVEQLFGMGDLASYRAYLEATQIAATFTANMTFEQAEMDGFYAANRDDHDAAIFYAAAFTAAAEAGTNDEGVANEVTEEHRQAAKAKAEALLAEFSTEAEGVNAYADYSKTAVETYFSEEIAQWLFTEAAAQEIKLFEGENDTWFVVQLISADDYDTVNAIELFIAYDAEGVELAEGVMTDEEKLAAVKESLESDNSLKNMEALVADYNTDGTDGKLENMVRNSAQSVSVEIMEWMLEEHSAGDWQAFETTDGYIVLYFTSYGESYRNLTLTSAMINQYISDTTAEALGTCKYDEDAYRFVYTDLMLGVQNNTSSSGVTTHTH